MALSSFSDLFISIPFLVAWNKYPLLYYTLGETFLKKIGGEGGFHLDDHFVFVYTLYVLVLEGKA